MAEVGIKIILPLFVCLFVVVVVVVDFGYSWELLWRGIKKYACVKKLFVR